MYQSFTAPYTASGRSALVGPPPWHYAGWLLNVEFECDVAQGEQLLARRHGRLTGRGCVHFAEWQTGSSGDDAAPDPVYAQYRETIVTVEIERADGTRVNFCPFIYVDQDIALLRGLLQGWPKKLGSTTLTRCLPLDHPAAAPLRPGTRLRAGLTVKERRLLEAELQLEAGDAEPLGFLARPTLGLVGWPDLRTPERLPQPELLRSDITGRVDSRWQPASAQLTRLDHPVEELSLLGPLRATRASAGWLGLTVRGALQA
ncbi:acetoacetate decarboxylase family protein [Caldimonas brevitalea]|uniref:Acetoacetate decarboxylase n=1 Tax=Caldimonas brevitalea TaxID=413882 RepID=A0A0G3BFC1_9BURK|nr:acetoacetate decarboxylase family protein [Caldimonas brevitalea]AKJ28017.1 acetoacetate decarboxylase [Caldimonas brevitalea]